MKDLFNKIVSIFLVIVVFFSTTSLSVDKHFCCNKLVDVSFFGNAKTCGMKDLKTSTKKCSIEDDDCCTTKTFTKKGDDALKMASFVLDTETLFFLSSYLFTYVDLFEGLKENVIPYENYTPPLISKNILVLHETFLI